MALVAPHSWQPAVGAELAISYGDKSNEELLFHYGECVCFGRLRVHVVQ